MMISIIVTEHNIGLAVTIKLKLIIDESNRQITS